MEREETFRNFEKCNISLERNSADTKTKAYGYQLINFCKNNNVFILNGRLEHSGPKLTCKNSSTVDYFVSTSFNFDIFSSITTHEFDSLLSDAHCPVSLTLTLIKTQINGEPIYMKNEESEPTVRKRTFLIKHKFNGEILKISSSLDVMASGYNISIESINSIVKQIERLFLSASESSFGYTHPKKKRPQIQKQTHYKMKPWFNRECHEARNLYHNTRKLSQQAHDVRMTSDRRRCDVMTSHRR